MKKIFLVVFVFFFHNTNAQVVDSFEDAKKEALAHNKLILIHYNAPIEYGNIKTLDFHFWQEINVNELAEKYVVLTIKTLERRLIKKKQEEISYKKENRYMKIVDANEKELIALDCYATINQVDQVLREFSLSTEFMSQDLNNYHNMKGFTTALKISQKYYDFAMLLDEKSRGNFISLGDDYLDEARSELSKKENHYFEKKQKLDLVGLYRFVYLFELKKLNKKIANFKENEILEENLAQFYFLKYVLAKGFNNENTSVFDEKAKTIDGFEYFIKKADFILSKKLQ